MSRDLLQRKFGKLDVAVNNGWFQQFCIPSWCLCSWACLLIAGKQLGELQGERVGHDIQCQHERRLSLLPSRSTICSARFHSCACQAEAQVMLKRKYGKIVNVASMSGHIVNEVTVDSFRCPEVALLHSRKSSPLVRF